VKAVDAFSLDVPAPRMVVLVGPSGCGKTTLLRMIAGLETPTTGSIHLGEKRLDSLEPRHRDVAMVFQSYALYPHMSVRDNLSFGLRLRKTPRDVIAAKVQKVAETLEIGELLRRKPGELSGGQRQRVALGRAIIREPSVFLFDEPLSNLDARLRAEMRTTIKRLYDRLRVTSVYVTHDQVEAMTIGEMLVVMHGGRILQVGTPDECYQRPANSFVASFLGSPAMNLMTCAIDGGHLVIDGAGRVPVPERLASRLQRSGHDRAVVGFRPEHLRSGPPPDGGGIELNCELVLEEALGHETLTHVRVGEHELTMRGQPISGNTEGSVTLYIENNGIHLFDAGSGDRMED